MAVTLEHYTRTSDNGKSITPRTLTISLEIDCSTCNEVTERRAQAIVAGAERGAREAAVACGAGRPSIMGIWRWVYSWYGGEISSPVPKKLVVKREQSA